MSRLVAVMLVGLAVLVAACASAAPEDAVTGYFEALVAGDETSARSLTCAEWEAVAAERVASFVNLDARLEGMACTAEGDATEGGTRVTCAGDIVITYGTEDQSLPLSTYRVVQEGGEWRMCGETN